MRTNDYNACRHRARCVKDALVLLWLQHQGLIDKAARFGGIFGRAVTEAFRRGYVDEACQLTPSGRLQAVTAIKRGVRPPGVGLHHLQAALELRAKRRKP